MFRCHDCTMGTGKGVPSCKPEERLVLSNEELNGIEMPKDFLSFFLAPSWLGLL